MIFHSARQAEFVPQEIGSCTELIPSTFPFLSHDVFKDACHQIYVPGQSFAVFSPSLVFLHPRDIQSFGEQVVQQLKTRIVLVSNSNLDECLPFKSSANELFFRDAYTRILASPLIVAWYGPNVVEHHPKLKPLPLGCKWNWQSTEHHSERHRCQQGANPQSIGKRCA